MERRLQLKPKLALQGLALDTVYACQLDEKVPWVWDILEELNEEVDASEREGFSSSLTLDLMLMRRSQESLHEYMTFWGTISSRYLARCVLSGEAVEEPLEIEFNAVALPESYRVTMGLEDNTVLFVDGQERDLFYYTFEVQVMEIIHEYLYLNRNPYPKKKESTGVL